MRMFGFAVWRIAHVKLILVKSDSN